MVRIPADLAPREIWDLGCGTGEHAAVLAARHPYAAVHGLDSSPEMLSQARTRSATIDWVLADLAGFHPEIAPDLIFTNAALHWTRGLQSIVVRLVQTLAPGGVFACQVPLSHSAGWYDALRQTAADPRWAARLASVEGTQPVPPPEAWHEWLSALTSRLDVWTTTYLHALHGDDPIVEWMSGAGLRPWLDGLENDADRQAFLAAYALALRPLFPRRADGVTLLPFPRLFVIARR